MAIGRAREIFERQDLFSELSPEVSGRIGKKILDAVTVTVTLPNPALANPENICNSAHDVAPRLKGGTLPLRLNRFSPTI
jgi:hypothetical protein